MAFLKQLKIAAPLILSRALKEDSPQRKRVNSFLVRQMGENKGLWLKVGQMLALHPESWEGLKDLPDSEKIPALNQEEFEPYVRELLNHESLSFEENIKEFYYPGLAASLSQVHRVELKDNSKWMMKIKLPGIKEVIEEQLSLFGILQTAQKLTSDKKSFSTSEYHKTLKQSFEFELDYDKERKNIKMMKALTERFPERSSLPELHPSFQGQDFITMKEVEGDSWETVLKTYSVGEKKIIAHELVKQVLYQYFCQGHCQGDFHPGNFLFYKNGEHIKIGWIDLGQCLHPTIQERLALYRAIKGTLNNDNISLGPLFAAWRFNLDKLGPISDRLPLLLNKIFSPFSFPSAFSLKNWHLKRDIDDILGEDRWWFRTAGSPDLFLSIRCWIGLFSMIEALDVEVFFHGIWRELEAEIQESIPQVELPKGSLENITFNDLAKNLFVQIFENNREKLAVQLPARALEHINDFISPDTLEEMEKADINLNGLIKEQLHRGLKPGTVVDFTENNKRYLVTLY